MVFEDKIISREIGDILYDSNLTVGTAESCTGGRIAEGLIAIPGASNYFKGGIICYSDEIKERILGVDGQLIETNTAVDEEVARQMVKGAVETLGVNYAIASTGFAGPGGGTSEIPVGTIWIACGTADNIVTMKLQEDFGRDINLAIATSKALRLFLDFLNDQKVEAKDEE
jgi:nicotinamide-nucleotide amidase